MNEILIERCNYIDSTIKKIDERKTDKACQHDACLLSILEKKANGVEVFIDYPAWLVTTDKGLIRFQQIDLEYKNRAPLVVMPSQLLGILGFTKPGDLSYAETFMKLFSRNFVYCGAGIGNEVIQKVLGRIEQYRGIPELAEKILSDQLLMREIEATHDEGELDGVVLHAMIEKAAEMQNELVHTQQTVNLLEEKVHLLHQDKVQLEEKGVSLRQKFDDVSLKMENEVKTVTNESEKLKEKSALWENRARILAAVFSAISIAIIGGLIAHFIFNVWFSGKIGHIVVALVLIGFTIVLVARVFLGKNMSSKLETCLKYTGWVCGISSVLGMIILNL